MDKDTGLTKTYELFRKDTKTTTHTVNIIQKRIGSICVYTLEEWFYDAVTKEEHTKQSLITDDTQRDIYSLLFKQV
jgi:hypothetical protein